MIGITEQLKSDLTQETLQLAADAFANPKLITAPGMQKAGFNIAQNLIGISLEAPSKKLFPVYSPLRNEINRHPSPVGASAVQWREIDAINAANVALGVAEATRNSFVTTNTSSKTASFISFGLDDYVSFEALFMSKGFEDVRSTASLNLLYATMIGEEKMILGGNATNLGAPGTPTLANAASGGSIPAATYTAKVSCLVLRGFLAGATGNGGADADGESTPSAASAGTVCAGSTSTITWSAVASVKGAVAYNLYLSNGGSYFYQGTFTINGGTQLTYTNSGNQPNATDKTGSALEFAGIIYNIATNASPAALYNDMGNTTLTGDNAGGIKQIDTILKAMWDNYRLGPTMILVNSQQALDITKLIGGSSNLAYRIYLQDGQKNITGGIFVSSYLNKFASSFAKGFPASIPIQIHPFLPAGTMIFYVGQLPYPNNQIPNVWELEVLQEYTYYDWPTTQRRYEFGIYGQEVLKPYFPKAQAMIVGIAASP